MRAGCLGLKYCEGSEAKTKFFCICVNMDSEDHTGNSAMWGRLLQIVWAYFFGEAKYCWESRKKKLFETVVGACTVISRSFPRVVNIVAWPVQRWFAYRGQLKKLCNDRGEIISKLKLVLSTTFPCKPKITVCIKCALKHLKRRSRRVLHQQDDQAATGRPSCFRRFIIGIGIYYYLAKCNRFIPDLFPG